MMDDLQNEIKRGIRLRPTKTRDASAPFIQAEGEKLKPLPNPIAATPTATLPPAALPPPPPPLPQAMPHSFMAQPPSQNFEHGQTLPPPPPPIPPPGLLGPPQNPKAPSATALRIQQRISNGPKVDIDKLFNEIKSGKRLRKTVTNDKSAPFIDRNSENNKQVQFTDQPDSSPGGTLPHGSRNGLTDQIVREIQGNRNFEKARAEYGNQESTALMQGQSLLVDVGPQYGSSSASPQSGDKCWSPRSSSGVSSGHSPGKVSITKEESKNPSPLSMSSPSSSEEDKFLKRSAPKSPKMISTLPELPTTEPPSYKPFHQDLLVSKLVQQVNQRSNVQEKDSQIYPAPKLCSPAQNEPVQQNGSFQNSASSTFTPNRKSVGAPGKVTFAVPIPDDRSETVRNEYRPEVVNAQTEPPEPYFGSSIAERKRSLSLHRLPNNSDDVEPAKDKQQSPIEGDELAMLPNVRKLAESFQYPPSFNAVDSPARRSRQGSRSSSSSAASSEYGENIRKVRETFEAQRVESRPLTKAASSVAINHRVNSLPGDMRIEPSSPTSPTVNGIGRAALFNGDGKNPRLLPDVGQLAGKFEQKPQTVKQPVGTGADHFTPKKFVKNSIFHEAENSNGKGAENPYNTPVHNGKGITKEGDRTVYSSPYGVRQRSASAHSTAIGSLQTSASSCDIGVKPPVSPSNGAARVVSTVTIHKQIGGKANHDPAQGNGTVIVQKTVFSRNGGSIPSHLPWIVNNSDRHQPLKLHEVVPKLSQHLKVAQSQTGGPGGITYTTTEESTITSSSNGGVNGLVLDPLMELERMKLSELRKNHQFTIGLEGEGSVSLERRPTEDLPTTAY